LPAFGSNRSNDILLDFSALFGGTQALLKLLKHVKSQAFSERLRRIIIIGRRLMSTDLETLIGIRLRKFRLHFLPVLFAARKWTMPGYVRIIGIYLYCMKLYK